VTIRNLMRGSLVVAALVTAAGSMAATGTWNRAGYGMAGAGWQGSRFVYQTNGSTIADTLNLFGAGQNVPIRLSGNVTGIVRGRFAMPPQQFLDTLCASFGLVWYYDGAVVEVSPASEQQSLAIRPNYLSPGALAAALDHAGAADPHFPLQLDTARGTVRLTGPATYVERIRSAARRFELDAQARTRTTARVVRLSSASAADRVRGIDGRNVVEPGAASLLKHRFRDRRLDTGGAQALEFDAPLPIIEADASTNSILIRDKPERIEGDAMLVADLDMAPQLVSIETWVVDADSEALADLRAALPLRVAVAGGVASEAASEVAGERAAGTLAFATAADGGRELFARLHALERAGHAHTEVSRTALTLNRSAAVIDRHEARLAQREAGAPDSAADLWLSVEPILDDRLPARRIGLRVDLGRAGDTAVGQPRHGHVVAANLALGECLVIVAPPAGPVDPNASQRLVLLIPRIVT
jgi:type III secretion protein C